MKYSIDKTFECCYGHRVWSQKLNSRFSIDPLCACRHLHGHQMMLKVGLGSDTLKLGMVTDFKHLNCIKKIVDDVIDHKFIIDVNDPLFTNLFPEVKDCELIDCKFYKLVKIPDSIQGPVREKLEGVVIVDFIPTSENLATMFYNIANETLKDLLLEQDVSVTYVDFWETPKSHCRYEP